MNKYFSILLKISKICCFLNDSFASICYYFAKNLQNLQPIVETLTFLTTDIFFKCVTFLHKYIILQKRDKIHDFLILCADFLNETASNSYKIINSHPQQEIITHTIKKLFNVSFQAIISQCVFKWKIFRRVE